jgi:hypothetical protein
MQGHLGRTLDTGDHRTVHNVTDAVLRTLDPREQEVICLAFGLRDGELLTYSAIGEKLGVGGERVRQIRNVALRKLQVVVNPDWPWPKGKAPAGGGRMISAETGERSGGDRRVGDR